MIFPNEGFDWTNVSGLRANFERLLNCRAGLAALKFDKSIGHESPCQIAASRGLLRTKVDPNHPSANLQNQAAPGRRDAGSRVRDALAIDLHPALLDLPGGLAGRRRQAGFDDELR